MTIVIRVIVSISNSGRNGERVRVRISFRVQSGEYTRCGGFTFNSRCTQNGGCTRISWQILRSGCNRGGVCTGGDGCADLSTVVM